MPLAFVATFLLLVGPSGPSSVGVGPKPSPTPISWELKLTFRDPERIDVQLPGTDKPETFWFMLYTVTNPGGRSQLFFPQFQIVTEDLHIHDTDMGISPLVFDAIRERYKQIYPYLVTPTKAIGDLLSGDDNARESVAIWRQIDLSNCNFTVYVAGLSGETRFVRNPTYDPSKPQVDEVGADGKRVVQNPKHFTLQKTLEIRYNLPGSADTRSRSVPERSVVRWIMR